MDGWKLLQEIRDGWPSVRAAKWIVVAGIVAGFVGGFGVSTLWWSGTSATLRERVSYWQDRAQGKTVVPGRHLTPEQKTNLTGTLRLLAPSIQGLLVGAESVPESTRYANEFIKVLKDA